MADPSLLDQLNASDESGPSVLDQLNAPEPTNPSLAHRFKTDILSSYFGGHLGEQAIQDYIQGRIPMMGVAPGAEGAAAAYAAQHPLADQSPEAIAARTAKAATEQQKLESEKANFQPGGLTHPLEALTSVAGNVIGSVGAAPEQMLLPSGSGSMLAQALKFGGLNAAYTAVVDPLIAEARKERGVGEGPDLAQTIEDAAVNGLVAGGLHMTPELLGGLRRYIAEKLGFGPKAPAPAPAAPALEPEASAPAPTPLVEAAPDLTAKLNEGFEGPPTEPGAVPKMADFIKEKLDAGLTVPQVQIAAGLEFGKRPGLDEIRTIRDAPKGPQNEREQINLQERGDVMSDSLEGLFGPESGSTPEPKADIAAQVQALLDPKSTKDSVFVARGNESAIPKDLPPELEVVKRPEGTLITSDPTKAETFTNAQSLSDKTMANILGFPESKVEASTSGAPQVVQAKDAEGNVVTEALSSPGKAEETSQALQAQAPDATIGVATPQEVLLNRAVKGQAESLAAQDLDAINQRLGPFPGSVSAKLEEEVNPVQALTQQAAEAAPPKGVPSAETPVEPGAPPPQVQAVRNPQVQEQLASGEDAPPEVWQRQPLSAQLENLSENPPPPNIAGPDSITNPNSIPRDVNLFESKVLTPSYLGKLFPAAARVYDALVRKSQYEGSLLRDFSNRFKDFTALGSKDQQAVTRMLYEIQADRVNNPGAKAIPDKDGNITYNGTTLTPEQSKGYQSAVDMTQRALQEMKTVQLTKMGLDPKLDSTTIAADPTFQGMGKNQQKQALTFLSSWEAMSQGHYFPVMRFGKTWEIVGKDISGDTVYRQQLDHVPTVAEQKKFIDAARAQHGFGPEVTFTTDKMAPFRDPEGVGVPELMSLDRMVQALGNVSHNEWNNIFEQALNKLRGEGPGSHFLQRKMIPGFDADDGLKVGANYILGMSRLLSNMLHADNIHAEVNSVDLRQPKLKATLDTHVTHALNPVEQLSGIKSLLALRDIGFSLPVAYKHTLNVPIRTFPLFMSYGVNPLKIGAHMAQGLADAVAFQMGRMDRTNPLYKILEEGSAKGFLGSRWTDDLYAQSNTGIKATPLQRTYAGALNAAGVFVREAEKLGRMSTYLAGRSMFSDPAVQKAVLDAAKKDPVLQQLIQSRGFTPDMFAEHMARESFFDYGRANTPIIMQGAVPGLIGMFNKVQTNYLGSMYTLAVLSARGNKQAAANLGMMLLAGGLINGVWGAVPSGHLFVELGDKIADLAGVPHADIERHMQEMLAHAGMSHEWIDRLNRGEMNDLAGFDLHTRSGLELPYTSMLSAVLSLGGAKPSDMLGASGSGLQSIVQGIFATLSGNPNWRSMVLQSIAPISAQRAYQWLWDIPQNGLKSQSGRTILTPEEIKNGSPEWGLKPITTAQRIAGAFGFTPSGVAEYQNRIAQVAKESARLDTVVQPFIGRGIEAVNGVASPDIAVRTQSQKDLQAVLKEFKQYNKTAAPEDRIMPNMLIKGIISGIMQEKNPQEAKIKGVPLVGKEKAMQILKGLNW